MLTDIEIARAAQLKKITNIANELDIKEEDYNLYGKYIAKVSHNYLRKLDFKKDGKLILVTAITPTPAGEGKTTTSIALSMALNKIKKNSIVTLREPSLGPVMGIKGGAAGGGYSQVLPMEDINLHFTGDIHAVTSAHNLISAVLDAYIKYDKLNIDSTRVSWPRAMDMNDRALREIVVGLGGKENGYLRQDGFVITAASEIMAILCLSTSLEDLKEKLSKIVVARNKEGSPITVKDLGIAGALTILLKDAINPNLVQTIENTAAFVHGGPFANIAHGTNAIVATKLSLKLADYVVTESGFGSDLGAEKFYDFVSPTFGLKPSATVLVATVRALKYHGGKNKKELSEPDLDSLRKGLSNLQVHIENLKKFNVPLVVSINKFDTDTEEELNTVEEFVKSFNVEASINDGFAKGSEGALDLAEKVASACEKRSDLRTIYNFEDSLELKIEKLAKNIYRASKVEYTSDALQSIKFLKKYGYDKLPIIMAKTQYSISDDPNKLGFPKDYTFTIRDFELSAGAGFIVALAGDILRMPGLSKVPNAVNMDIDKDGVITGLS
ncbi:formate--tetrahydrofolate ligase [Petrotoga sp. 9PWA.NaAc.5.4]|uniref:formate--tetrahydrofolate ligase n=1 Tax=Petrotoga sp. 9PWA.NaAc.5.4 TaxID=1434328 RepID=UPI000CAC6C74|nr:formate--tetrahydrofolate ligase [Petrotoga sp. 9PWA.NaAc.5.4]PNR92801.1 formate--tetrahydrofolate ligase [Petrotoga sp. 9PWA.NaAc.5.4]